MSETKQPSFWSQGTTWLQIITIVIPLVMLLGGWMVSMQVTANRHDYILSQQAATLKDVQSDIRKLAETDASRGERLARIEAKIDLMMAHKGSANGSDKEIDR